MSARRFIIGLALSLSLFAATAGDALAATELKTAPASWEIGETLLVGSEGLKCSIKSTNFKLVTSIFGAEVELQAKGLSCPEATITNEKVEGVSMAVASGKLIFTGMSVVKPAGCKTPETLTTELIKSKIDMHLENGVPTGRLITTTEPVTGTKLASVKITECAIAGTYVIAGKTVGESTVETGQLAKNIPVIFNAATNAAGAMTLGGFAVTITGEANRELTSGKEFRVTEK